LDQQRGHREQLHGVHQLLRRGRLPGGGGQLGRELPHLALELLNGGVHVRHGEVEAPGRRRHRGDGARGLPEHRRAPRRHPRGRAGEVAIDALGRLGLRGADAAAQGLDAVRAVAHGGADGLVLCVRVAEAEPAVRGLPPRQVRLRVLGRLGVEHALVPLRRRSSRRPPLVLRPRRLLLSRDEVALDAGLDGAGELVHVAGGEAVQLLPGPHGADEQADGEADEDADGDGGDPLLRHRHQRVHAVPRHGHQAVRQDEDGHPVVEPRLHRRYEPRERRRRGCTYV
ncbi:Os04g0567350, partial [Oryza sativa Japonica Group]